MLIEVGELILSCIPQLPAYLSNAPTPHAAALPFHRCATGWRRLVTRHGMLSKR